MSHPVTFVVQPQPEHLRLTTMSTRGRSTSPRSRDVDVDMDKQSEGKPDAKVIVVTHLTRNVVETHLQTIFAFYGEIVKIELPIYAKCAFPTHAVSFLFFPCASLSFLTHPVLCSGPKQRESLARIRGRGLRSNGRIPHERRTTRRRGAQSRAIRLAPPNALALSPTASPLPPAKRSRP
jgi:hypothetical protein